MARAIIALDVSTLPAALAIADSLGSAADFFKVGSELFTAAGPEAVRTLSARHAQVFLDLKFHDIPTTVRRAAHSAASLGAGIITVHASGGQAMVEAAVEGAGQRCDVFAVTVLTSLDHGSLGAAWGRTDSLNVQTEVMRLADVAHAAGARGVVCSGNEAAALRSAYGDGLSLLIPGIRLVGAAPDDQARVVTPRAAVELGANYLVLGRTVTAATDPPAALAAALAEMRVGESSGRRAGRR